MAGPQTIQRYPAALLPLLGIQSGGVAPQEISQVVGGQLDLLDFYTRDRWENVQIGPLNISSAGLIANANSGGTPAGGEQWLLYGASLQTAGQAAGTTGRYQIALYLSGNTPTAVTIPIGDTISLAAAEVGSMGQWFQKPVLMRPGDTLALWTQSYTGAGATQFFWNMVIARIKG